jgi:hypothetical protein
MSFPITVIAKVKNADNIAPIAEAKFRSITLARATLALWKKEGFAASITEQTARRLLPKKDSAAG